MHQGFLGIDLARTPQLTAALTDARATISEATTLVLEAEALCDLTTGAVGPLDDVGRDFAAMAAAVGAAASELATFRLPPIRRTRRRAGAHHGGSAAGAASVATRAGRRLSTSRSRPHPRMHTAESDTGSSTSRTRPDHRPPPGDGPPAFADIGLDHVAAGVAAATPELAAGLGERADHQRWLAGIIDDTRVGGPPIRLDPRFTMADTRYWFTWARHDLQIQRSALAARTRAAGFGGAAATTRVLGRVSLVAGGALSAYTIFTDGKVAYTSSNGDAGVTTIAVLRATAGEAIESTAVSIGGALCSPGGPVAVGVCAWGTDVAIDGQGVELVDEYFRALDDVADDMGIMNVADQRSLGQRVVDLFDLTPWS